MTEVGSNRLRVVGALAALVAVALPGCGNGSLGEEAISTMLKRQREQAQRKQDLRKPPVELSRRSGEPVSHPDHLGSRGQNRVPTQDRSGAPLRVGSVVVRSDRRRSRRLGEK